MNSQQLDPALRLTQNLVNAFRHVRKKTGVDTTIVTVDDECRWQYQTKAGECPSFGRRVDVGILEDAVCDIEELPAVFIYDPDTDAIVSLTFACHEAAQL